MGGVGQFDLVHDAEVAPDGRLAALTESLKPA